jgi:hypothetical protein
MKHFIAVDPGLSGGLAFGNTEQGLLFFHKMPPTDTDTADLLRQAPPDTAVIIEKLPVFFPGAKGGMASMAKLQRNAGVIYGICAALKLRMIEVSPHDWQKHFRLGTRSKSANGYTEWKNKLKAEAQRRYPQFKITHAVADAVLILEWRLESEKA